MSRWTLLLTLMLIPAALLATWGILSFGGSIEELAAEEERRSTEALEALATDLRTNLVGVALAPQPQLEEVEEKLGVAARIGAELEGAGDPGQALVYFESADAPLPPGAHLAFARALLATDRTTEAHALLAREMPRDRSLDGVPLALTATVLRARAAAARQDPEGIEDAWTRVLDGTLYVPPHLAQAVVDNLSAAGPPTDPAAVEDYLWTATAHRALEAGLVDRNLELAPLPHGGLLLTERDKLVTPRALDAFIADAAKRIGERFDMNLAQSSEDALASLDLAGVRLTASAPGTRGSDRLRLIAQLCLGLALATFLVGNLVLFQIARKSAALSRLKADFIDVVSHELRTPLTALAVKSEMLAHGDVPPHKTDDYQRTLQDDVRRLSALVHDILDFGRLEQGRYRLSPSRVPVRSLVSQAILASRDALRLRGQKLLVDVPRQLPELFVDVEVIVRALRNLIDNATKHAPAGSEISVRARASTGNVILTVGDRGSGLGGSDPRQLFQPFRKGQGSGTGLGLAIVDRAVRAHGGKARALERSGGGAEFRMELPRGERVR